MTPRPPLSPIPLRWSGRIALTLAHIAGMIDLVALPVWVGTTLIGQYHYSATQAGLTVTAFLLSVVVASLTFAPRFHRFRARSMTCGGFSVALSAFMMATQIETWSAMLALHVAAGLGVGTALSFTHGTIGRTARPHALFAFVSVGMGVSGIIFLGTVQSLVPQLGGTVLFFAFSVLMALAALACAAAFPSHDDKSASAAAAPGSQAAAAPAAGHADPRTAPIPASVWWCIAGTTLLSMCQATMFSFAERIGVARGFGEQVVVVLVAGAFVNLFTPIAATLLERRLTALKVGMVGAALQGTIALVLALDNHFPSYALGIVLFVPCVIFSHTFLFGWTAASDPSGRAVALTPAMMMSGSAIGPALGGTVASQLGMDAIGVMVALIDVATVLCIFQAYRRSQTAPAGRLKSAHT